jgi:sigma-B regulation protein RsbU (phosphoserine phosphatase)
LLTSSALVEEIHRITIRPERGGSVEGTTPLTQGELGSENRQLFLVLSGELGVHLESKDTQALTRIGAGATVGEISLIDRKPASAYVIAAAPTRVLSLDEELEVDAMPAYDT